MRRWLLDLRRRNLRDRTQESYTERVDLLVRWAAGRPLLGLGTDDIETWLDSRRLGASSRGAYIAAVRSLYRWAVGHDLIEVDPTAKLVRPRVRPGRPRPLADDTLGRALASAPASTRVMLLLGALAGMRVSEIANLSAEDVDFTAGLVEIVDGKGGRSRILPMHPVLAAALRSLPLPLAGPVFRSRAGGRMTPHGVGDRIRAVLTEGTPHALRHTAGTAWWQVSHDIRTVSELLGHADPRTSLIYARFDIARAAEVVGMVKVPGTWN